jgi:proliferating cell nuclear antigen
MAALEARLSQAVALKKVIEGVKDLVTDVNLDCNEGGLTMQSMDSAHVALVSLLIRNKAFETFKVEKDMSLGLNMEHLSKIFRVCGNDDSLSVRVEKAQESIFFTFEDTKANTDKLAELKLMELEQEPLGIGEMEYDAVVKMPCSEFQKITRDLSQIGETVTISVSNDSVRFAVSGDLGTVEVVLKPRNENSDNKSEQVKIEYSGRESVELSFQLRFLGLFAKAAPLCDQVHLSLSAGIPLRVQFDFGTESAGYLRYYLAPRVDDSSTQS